jgi:NAD(P)H dehydrogenase (quinone)
VKIFQVAELAPPDVLEKSGAKAARAAFAHVPLARHTAQIAARLAAK